VTTAETAKTVSKHTNSKRDTECAFALVAHLQLENLASRCSASLVHNSTGGEIGNCDGDVFGDRKPKPGHRWQEAIPRQHIGTSVCSERLARKTLARGRRQRDENKSRIRLDPEGAARARRRLADPRLGLRRKRRCGTYASRKANGAGVVYGTGIRGVERRGELVSTRDSSPLQRDTVKGGKGVCGLKAIK
jgi:hypothetical protein